MKNFIIICLLIIACLLSSFLAHAQALYQGTVKDLKSLKGLPFAAIAIKNSAIGTLANEDGVFNIAAKMDDTLIIAQIGYERKQIQMSSFVREPIVLLKLKDIQLDEVTVLANNLDLYEVLEKSRDVLMAANESASKVYFTLQTKSDKQNLELVECYYNGYFDSNKIDNLVFKNGRIGLAAANNQYFLNLNSSKVFVFLDLLHGNDHLPHSPFEYKKGRMKKLFILEKAPSGNDNFYLIKFLPKRKNDKLFSGEVYIDSKSYSIIKIYLKIANTSFHPFLPLHKNVGEVSRVGIEVSKEFTEEANGYRLSHMTFNYRLTYRRLKNDPRNVGTDTLFDVYTQGLMYFYDYGNLFYEPQFKYSGDFSDYQKIALLTYNDNFWSINTGLVRSREMQKAIMYFKNYGSLLNYSKSTSNEVFKKGIFEHSNIVWSGKQRLFVNINHIVPDTTQTYSFKKEYTEKNYDFRCQIFFDANQCSDSIQYYSASIWDIYQSYYYGEASAITNCFINIYFDLCEIERRKMDRLIHKNKFSILQMDSLYRSTVTSLALIQDQYLEEVEKGNNLLALEKWNNYVYEKLNVDNFNLFSIVPKR